MIREATLHDINKIAILGKDFVDTAWKEIASYDVQDTIDWLYSFMRLSHSIIYVVEIDKEIVGMIAGMAIPFYFNQAHLNAQELFWWVTPEHRHSSIGIKLLKTFEEWAISKGAKTIQMGTVARINPEKLASVYRKLGYIESETYYTKVL